MAFKSRDAQRKAISKSNRCSRIKYFSTLLMCRGVSTTKILPELGPESTFSHFTDKIKRFATKHAKKDCKDILMMNYQTAF